MDEKTTNKIKEDLIGTGIFLEADTFNLFDTWKHNRQFEVYREYPYGFQLHGSNINGTCDILAVCGVSAVNPFFMVFVIECKKASPDLKHWVFEKHPPKRDKQKLFYPIIRADRREYTQKYFFPSLGYRSVDKFENAVNVFEFSKVTGKLKNQAQKELRAYYAIKQANEAATGVAHKFNDASTYAKQKEYPYVVIPTVVTTANLWVADYNVKDISKADGTIDISKLNLEERNWLMWAHPLEYTDLYGGRTDDDIPVNPDKRPTFIVKSENLEEFIQLNIEDWQNHFDW